MAKRKKSNCKIVVEESSPGAWWIWRVFKGGKLVSTGTGFSEEHANKNAKAACKAKTLKGFDATDWSILAGVIVAGVGAYFLIPKFVYKGL